MEREHGQHGLAELEKADGGGADADLTVVSSAAPLNVLELVGGLALGLVVIVGVAAVARRLLGVRVGAVRLLVAGVVGYTIGALVSTAMERADVPAYAVASVLVGIQLSPRRRARLRPHERRGARRGGQA